MGIPGAIGSVGICAEGEGVENALDVVLLDGGEEGFVGGGVVGEGGSDGLHVGSVDVFHGDEFQPAITVGVRGWFQACIESGFPDHVADAVADKE